MANRMLPPERIFLGFILLGAVVAILMARIFVSATGITQVYFYGYKLHHFYYGVVIIIAAWFALVVSDVMEISVPDKFLSFAIGAGLGLIADEITLLVHIGNFTLADYYNPINYLSDFLLVVILLILTFMQIPHTYMDEVEL